MIVAVTQNTRESYMKFKKFNLLKKELFSSILAPVLLIAIGVAMLFFNPAFGIICIAGGNSAPRDDVCLDARRLQEIFKEQSASISRRAPNTNSAKRKSA